MDNQNLQPNGSEPIQSELTPAAAENGESNNDILCSFSTLFSETEGQPVTPKTDAPETGTDSEFDQLKKQFRQMDQEEEKHRIGEQEISGIRSALDSVELPDAEIPVVWETDAQENVPPVSKPVEPKIEKPIAKPAEPKTEEPLIPMPDEISEGKPKLSVEDFIGLQTRIETDVKRKEHEDEQRFQAAPDFSEAMREIRTVSTDHAISLGAEVLPKRVRKEIGVKTVVSRLLAALAAAAIVGGFGIGVTGYCVFRGPSTLFRNKCVVKAQSSVATRWIPALFLDDKTVNQILNGQNGEVK